MSLYDDSPNENGDKMDSENYSPSKLKNHEVAEGNGKTEISEENEENQEKEVSRRLSKDRDISRSPSKERKSPRRSHSNDRKSRSRSKSASRERGRSYSRSRSRSRGRRSHNKRRRSRSRSESPRSRRRRSRSRSRTPSEGARLHIAEIDVDTRKRDLEKTFEKYGTLREVWMARNPPCFAFVVFKHRRDAEDALRHTDGMMIGRCHIKVTMARPRVRGGRFRSFDQNLRCYQCGEVGHFSRNCTDTKFGYKRPQTPPRSRRHRSRSRSRGRRSRS